MSVANEDYRRLVRRSIQMAMKHAAGIADLIPAGSIYSGTVPAERTLPFSRVGSIIGSPFRASGLDSGSYRIMLQAFTQGGTTSIFFLPASRRKSDSLSVWAISSVIEAA